MEDNRPAENLGGQEPGISQGHDYEYDEAHDATTMSPGRGSRSQPVDTPPDGDFGDDGDFEYDEAHDFGTS